MSEEVKLASEIWELTQEKAELADQTKKVNAAIKEKQAELLEVLMEEGKTSTGHIAGVGVFTMARSIYPSVRAPDMPGFIDTLRGTDDFGMVKETIAAPTLRAYLKGKIEEMKENLLDHPDMMIGFEDKSVDEIVMNKFSERGVSMFDEVALRHTEKGK